MKIEQQPKFQPITITLETEDEANFLWDLIINAKHAADPQAREFADMLSNWLSNCAQMGGRK